MVDKQIWKGKKNYTEKYFILSRTRSKIFDNWRVSARLLHPHSDAPNKWNRYGGKPYEDDATNSLLSFVRKARAAQSEDLLAAAASGQLEPVYRAVNGQMLTPFVINKKVYAAMRYLIENDVRDLNGERVNKALDMDEYDIPASPNKKELDKHQFNVARDFRNEQIENKLLSDANILQLNRDISFIETVLTVNNGRFFVPVNLDHRGRFTCIPGFHYHRGDHTRLFYSHAPSLSKLKRNSRGYTTRWLHRRFREGPSELGRNAGVEANMGFIMAVAKITDTSSMKKRLSRADEPGSF